MNNDMLHQKIVEEYKKNGSVGYTAELLGTNKTKVRRVLITYGLWSSKTTREVAALRDQGLSTKEIAEKLCLSEKAVQTYLPYTRVFKTDKSSEATRCKKYRDRKESAVNRQVSREGQGGIKLLERSSKKDYRLPKALKIRLELDLSYLSNDEKKVLYEKADMKSGITRDVIVPSNLSLHALHYLIQRAFGWQNCHMHNFGFPRDVFNELTKNSVERYLSLCGVYFRFPDGDIYAMFYDDDYSGDVSLNSWLKSKYTGPEYNETLDDLYYENQIKVEEFRKSVRYPSDDNMEHLITDDVHNKLIERLTLMDYLILPGGACDAYRGQLEEMLKKIEKSKPEMIDRWTEYISNPERYWRQLEELHDFSTIRFQSQSNYIEYYYDYGDDWKVNITCTNVYFDDYSDEIDAETVDQVIAEHRPICVKSDGLDLIEDVGGVSGFVEFLTTSSDPSNKNFESSNEWAANRGWSRRKTSPKRKI